MDYATGKVAEYDFAAQMTRAVQGRLHHAGVVGHRLGDPVFKVVDVIVGLRVTVDKEREGLDLTEHTASAPTTCKLHARAAGRIPGTAPRRMEAPVARPGPLSFVRPVRAMNAGAQHRRWLIGP